MTKARASSPAINKSPLRFPGGKQKVANKIFQLFPVSAAEYREPLVGGGSVFLYARQKEFAARYWINDIDPGLISFWSTVSDHGQKLQLMDDLKKLRNSFSSVDEIEEYYLTTKKEAPETDFRRAIIFFFMNRVTFSGTVHAGGFSKAAATGRFTESSIQRLERLSDWLTDSKITCGDFEPVLQEPGEDVFLFLDPPHLTGSKLYGKNGEWSKFEHGRLADLLKKTTHKFLMTLDDCSAVRNFYSWANISEWNVRYGMTNSGREHKSKLGNELLISNYKLEGNS